MSIKGIIQLRLCPKKNRTEFMNYSHNIEAKEKA